MSLFPIFDIDITDRIDRRRSINLIDYHSKITWWNSI